MRPISFLWVGNSKASGAATCVSKVWVWRWHNVGRAARGDSLSMLGAIYRRSDIGPSPSFAENKSGSGEFPSLYTPLIGNKMRQFYNFHACQMLVGSNLLHFKILRSGMLTFTHMTCVKVTNAPPSRRREHRQSAQPLPGWKRKAAKASPWCLQVGRRFV